MTADERAERERLELLRMERYEAFCQRVIERNRNAETQSRAVCDTQLRERRVPQFEFSI